MPWTCNFYYTTSLKHVHESHAITSKNDQQYNTPGDARGSVVIIVVRGIIKAKDSAAAAAQHWEEGWKVCEAVM